MGIYLNDMSVLGSLSSLSLWLAANALGAPASPTLSCPHRTTSAGSQALDWRVEAGDSRAAFCLATRLQSLDGGELEGALVALGQYGDQRPGELLLLARRGVLSRLSLADAVTMLPLSLTDDLPAQARAMKNRRDRFRRVAQPALFTERDLALRSIDSALAEIRGHIRRH